MPSQYIFPRECLSTLAGFCVRPLQAENRHAASLLNACIPMSEDTGSEGSGMERIKQNSKKPGSDSKASSQTARAVLSLREMLVQGRFRPGERIREVPLAAELKVSRIPLHLALERLAHEGFLEVRPTRGFVVQRFSTEDIYDAIELRGLLEGAAARLAAERFKHPSELSALQATSYEILTLVRRTKLTMDTFNRYIDLNAQFHGALIDLSRSRMLRRAIQQACTLP